MDRNHLRPFVNFLRHVCLRPTPFALMHLSSGNKGALTTLNRLHFATCIEMRITAMTLNQQAF